MYYFLNLAQPNDVFFMQERSLQKSTVPVYQHLSVALTDLLKKEEYKLKAKDKIVGIRWNSIVSYCSHESPEGEQTL